MANFYGDDSNDVMWGGFTNFYGGNGNDSLKGAAGAEQLYGGDGIDVLAGGTPDLVNVNFTGDGSSGNPYKMNDNGASGADTLEGGDDSDALYGMDGNDILSGGEGNESGVIAAIDGTVFYQGGLFGGDGDDVIYGGGGDDEIYGGLGQDDLYGGNDSDTFVFASIEEIGKGSTSDYIGDFSSKQNDLIDLSAIDANPNKAGDQKFKWIGDDSFSKAGQVSFKNGKVKINTDSDKGAEAVLIVNTNKMDADDFIL